jgi:hypothetical protein
MCSVISKCRLSISMSCPLLRQCVRKRRCPHLIKRKSIALGMINTEISGSEPGEQILQLECSHEHFLGVQGAIRTCPATVCACRMQLSVLQGTR